VALKQLMIMRTDKVVLGTLIGLAMGAIAGILLAPEKGSVLRKQIMDKSDGYLDELKSKMNEFADSLTQKIENSKRNAEELVDNGKARFDEARKEVKNTVHGM
jgi:gas vesicle protein